MIMINMSRIIRYIIIGSHRHTVYKEEGREGKRKEKKEHVHGTEAPLPILPFAITPASKCRKLTVVFRSTS